MICRDKDSDCGILGSPVGGYQRYEGSYFLNFQGNYLYHNPRNYK
jgi:hypothetical protein